jgi:para-nitrobenzyl esterase
MIRTLHPRRSFVLVLALASSSFALAACSDDEPASDDGSDAGAGPASDESTEGPGGSGDVDAGATASAGELDPSLVVTVSGGDVAGERVGGAVRYLAIPYAEPPVGELRFAAPVPAAPWSGVRFETDFASPCPQPPSQQGPASMDEDCLYLNVWAPDGDVSDAPVMVWIHGGGFRTGSAADIVPLTADHLWYDGKAFAERHGVVVVTLNYRLGPLGFLAHPALADEGAPVGNQGLLDQQLALQWVHDNAEAFGGDPDNVTLFGESAGSASVCMHLVSPGSRGLFHRAISESGGCTSRRDSDPQAVADEMAAYAASVGCEGDDVIACLRGKQVTELVSQEMVDRTMGVGAVRGAFSFGAVVDGEGGFLPEPAIDLFERGELAQVPYLLGSNTDEAQLYFISATVPADEDAYVTEITDTYGDFAERVLELYPLSRFDGDIRAAMVRISSDSGLVCSTHDTARRAAAAGLPVYMYNFNIAWSVLPTVLGKSHASEISHVFGSPYMESPENEAVADAMNAYWAQFALSGDPNYPDAPATWPSFSPDANDDDLRLQLDPDFDVLESFRKDECALWRDYAARDAG